MDLAAHLAHGGVDQLDAGGRAEPLASCSPIWSNDLYRRLNALTRQDPSVPKWKQLLPGTGDDVIRSADLVRRLVAQMEPTIGSAIPARDELLSLEMRT